MSDFIEAPHHDFTIQHDDTRDRSIVTSVECKGFRTGSMSKDVTDHTTVHYKDNQCIGVPGGNPLQAGKNTSIQRLS